jgi:hypothetical protein
MLGGKERRTGRVSFRASPERVNRWLDRSKNALCHLVSGSRCIHKTRNHQTVPTKTDIPVMHQTSSRTLRSWLGGSIPNSAISFLQLRLTPCRLLPNQPLGCPRNLLPVLSDADDRETQIGKVGARRVSDKRILLNAGIQKIRQINRGATDGKCLHTSFILAARHTRIAESTYHPNATADWPASVRHGDAAICTRATQRLYLF